MGLQEKKINRVQRCFEGGSQWACCYFLLHFIHKARLDETTTPMMKVATKSHCKDVDVVRGGELGHFAIKV